MAQQFNHVQNKGLPETADISLLDSEDLAATAELADAAIGVPWSLR